MRDNKDGYSGWANYPTWNIALWINNDQGLQENILEAAGQAEDAHDFAEYLENFIDEMHSEIKLEGMAADIWGWAFGQVDWYELAEAFIEDAKELEA